MIKIIKATINDIDTIVDYKIKMFEESGHLDLLTDNAYDVIKSEYIKFYQDNTAIHFLAINNEDRIIGCCGAFIKTDIPYCFFKQPSYGFIGDVYVVPEERHRGYATTLIKESINHFKKIRITTIRLLASDDGKIVYEKLGFVSTDEMKLNIC